MTPAPRSVPLPLPAQVGSENLPVVASALVNPDSYPYEYIAMVDRDRSDLTRRYATLRVWVWNERVIAESGHYDMDWDEARQDFLERAQFRHTPLSNRLAT